MRGANLRTRSWYPPPLQAVALGLVLASCVGDRPDPIEDHAWIQTSTDHVVFQQAAFSPESLAPATAEVRLVYAGAAAPPGEPLIGVTGSDGPWLAHEVQADASGWALTLRPVDTAFYPAGIYSMRVDVRWEGATNSPAPIEVILVVGPSAGLWAPGQPSVAQRYLHTTTALNDGGALVIGGRFAEDQVERLDRTTGRWSAAGALLLGRGEHTATLLQTGKVFVAGGRASLENGPEGTWELYDPDDGTMTSGSLLAPRYGHAAVLLQDGRVLLVGGADPTQDSREIRSAEIFDPWTLRSELVGDLHGSATPSTAAALLPDGRVLVTNRTADGEDRGAEIFDPATNSWTVVAPRPSARTSHALVALEDGRVLLAGGVVLDAGPAGTPLATELYDPSTGQWSIAAPQHVLHAAARDATVLLPTGRVLVAGGASSATGSVVEIFDPALGAWSVVGSLGAPRELHTVTVLGDGRLVSVGGTPLQDRPELWTEAVAP